MSSRNYDFLKIFNLLIGIITIVIAIIILIIPTVGVIIIIFTLVFALLISGIGRVVTAIQDLNLAENAKKIKMLSGIIAIIISMIIIIATMINPSIPVLITIYLLAIAMLLIGLSRVLIGYQMDVDNQFKKLSIVGGLVLIIISALIIIFPVIGEFIIGILLGISLLIAGLIRIVDALYD